MLAARIKNGVEEGGIGIGDVGDLGMIQLHQHVGTHHALDPAARGHDHIIAGIAALELGK